jgi:hypothetical protein
MLMCTFPRTDWSFENASDKGNMDGTCNLFIDQFHPFVAAIDKARAANPKNRIGSGDVVHPGQPGQTLMAAEILKGMSFPTLVAAVEINVTSRKVVQNKNCQIEGLKVAADGRNEFQQKDNALPFFPDGDAKTILQWVPVLEQMNAYHLKVSGLKTGQYEVRLGGVKVAEYSAAQLGAGVNLAAPALTAGPIAEQVKAVIAAISAKNSYFHDRIFCEVLRGGDVPAFMGMKREQVEAKRMEVFNERMKMMPHCSTPSKNREPYKPIRSRSCLFRASRLRLQSHHSQANESQFDS